MARYRRRFEPDLTAAAVTPPDREFLAKLAILEESGRAPEDWLSDGLAAVRLVKTPVAKPIAYLTRCLAGAAARMTPPRQLTALLASVTVPAAVLARLESPPPPPPSPDTRR